MEGLLWDAQPFSISLSRRALEDAPCLFLGNNKIVFCYLIVVLEVEVIFWWLLSLYLLCLLHLGLALEMHLNFEQNKTFESMLQASKIKGMQQQLTSCNSIVCVQMK